MAYEVGNSMGGQTCGGGLHMIDVRSPAEPAFPGAPPTVPPDGSAPATRMTPSAGQGENNIRRRVIGNDWLEAIVALPLNMFHNTGITTYVRVLTNRKPEHRRGEVQLIDATKWFRPLRKNPGKKNCELGEADIARICQTVLDFEDTEQGTVFDNRAFGHGKVTVERPLHLTVDLSEDRRERFFGACVEAGEMALGDAVHAHMSGKKPRTEFRSPLAALAADQTWSDLAPRTSKTRNSTLLRNRGDGSGLETIARFHSALRWGYAHDRDRAVRPRGPCRSSTTACSPLPRAIQPRHLTSGQRYRTDPEYAPHQGAKSRGKSGPQGTPP